MSGDSIEKVDFAAAAAAVKSEAAAEPAVDTSDFGDGDHPGLAVTPDVASQDWASWATDGVEDEDQPAETAEEETEATAEENVSAKDDGPQTIKYKANGEEVEISVEEAAKRLSLADGARKVFSDNDKLRKTNKQLVEENKANKEIVDLWNKLEAVKDDERQLYNMITGRNFDEIIRKEAQWLLDYRDASPEEQRAMEAERVAEDAKRSLALRDKDAKKADERREQERYEIQKSRVFGAMEAEFRKHELPEGVDPAAGNRLKKMLWRNSIEDIKDLKRQKQPITASAIARVFAENAAALKSFSRTVETQQVKEEVVKEKVATEKAKAASTKNYPKTTVDQDIAKLNPLDMFYKLRRKG